MCVESLQSSSLYLLEIVFLFIVLSYYDLLRSLRGLFKLDPTHCKPYRYCILVAPEYSDALTTHKGRNWDGLGQRDL